MRIESGSQPTVSGVSAASRPGAPGRTQPVQGGQGVQSAFQVQLSNLVEGLSSVQASSGVVRPDKIAEISSRLAQGNYSISGSEVAAKMLLALQA